MTELTRPQNAALSAKPTFSEVSRPVWRLLVDGNSIDAIQDLLANLAFHREVIEAFPSIRAHAEPCGRAAVLSAVGKLFAVFPQPDRSEGEWAAFWETYTDALADLPLEALTAGVKAAVRAADAEFLPKPGPLRALCAEHAGPIWSALYRARKVAETPERRSRARSGEDGPRPTLAELRAILPNIKKVDP